MCPATPGWARQSTIEVAIAPGPATSGVASGTSAMSSGSVGVAAGEVGAAQHLERDQHQEQAAGDRERAERDVQVAEHDLAEDREAEDQRTGGEHRAHRGPLALPRCERCG